MTFRPLWLGVLLALAICPYYVDLGGSAIWDANEAFYVETPREMIERGDYISPTFNYEPRQNKPVLSYWVVAAFYHAFGISPGVQRIPIALGAMIMIATAFFLAWAGTPGAAEAPAAASGPDLAAGAEGFRRPRLEAALWAALGLAMTPRLLMFARRIIIDVFISMFMGLTLLMFALSERFPARRRTFLLLMYVAIGLGVLTKGPIAVLLPGAAFAAYLLLHRELGRVRTMMLPAGALVVAAIVVPWYAALYVREGWNPIASFVFGENLARYTEGVGVDSHRGPFFYLPVLFSDSFPWSLFLIAAGSIWLADWRPIGRPDAPLRVRTLMWIWIAVIVLFFTASAAKQDLYIFPIVPAVAALAGITIVRGLRTDSSAVRWTAAAIGMLVAIGGAGVVYLLGSGNGVYSLDGARIMGIAGVAGGTGAALLALGRRSRAALLATTVTFVVLDWVFVARALPSFERYKPVPGFATTLEPLLRPDDLLVTYDEALPSLVYYLRRHVDPVFVDSELIEKFRAGRTVYAVLSTGNYHALKDRLGVPTCEIERRPTFDVKLKNMIRRDALPELVLITNRCLEKT